MAISRKALITGGTDGIGLAIAERLAQDGYTPILDFAHNAEQASAAVERIRRIRPDTRSVRADVTREAEVGRMVEDATSDGPIDLLVNNVGAFLMNPLLETSLDEWNAILAANLTSVFLCCRAVLPAMRTRGSGLIVNVASMHAERPRAVPNTVPYAIAKAGVALLTRTLAKTEGPYGIRVNAVAPGFVDTGRNVPANASSRIALRRIGRPEEIASAVAYLASEDASYVTGAILDVHGGALL